MTGETYTVLNNIGLRQTESRTLVELFLDGRTWAEVRTHCLTQNVFPSRARSTTSRLLSELIPRLQHLHPEELQYLAAGFPDEQRLLLWVALCRSCDLVRDFALRLMRPLVDSGRSQLTDAEINGFFADIAALHAPVRNLRLSTERHMRTALLRCPREAGLLSPQNVFLPPILPAAFVRLLCRTSPRELLFFPVPHPRLQELIHE